MIPGTGAYPRHIEVDKKLHISGITDGSGITEASSGVGSNQKGDSNRDERSKGSPMTRWDPHPLLGEFKSHSTSYPYTGDPLPTDDNGIPFCLSFHLVRRCFDNCSRHRKRGKSDMKLNHRAVSDAEEEKLAKWCKAHFK